MKRLGQAWKRVPAHIRKTIVLIVGMALVIASPFTGVLPGPGGIPIFLIGVAILATEFQWAERLRNYFLMRVHWLSQHYRNHRTVGNIIIALLVVLCGGLMFVFYTYLI